jgi:ATP-dependent RNA helicase DeaD
VSNFQELGLKPDFIKGLEEMRIVTPSEIQKRVIPILLHGRVDFIGQAQTGTGKTAAYGLPLLQNTIPKIQKIQGLILCPTRELGQQVAKQLFKFTKYTDRIFVESVYGGPNIEKQKAALKRPTHIVVATPGRLIDLMKQDAIDLSSVKTVVLDEADEMLSMGFKKELDTILNELESIENKWLFSATMPDGIKQIINKHLKKDATSVQLNARNTVNKNIEHQYLICDEKEKFKELMKVLSSIKKDRGLIFCRTKEATKELAEQLDSKDIKTVVLHGDLLQKERDKAMRIFKKGDAQILISTDIAARGIDVEDLKFVIHFQLPGKKEYYTHRAGRTARAGKEGVSLCLITSTELKQIRFFEKNLKIVFNQVKQSKS